MINYEIIKGIRTQNVVSWMLFKRNKILLEINYNNYNNGSIARYNILKEGIPIFSTNDRYVIKVWMDLNGMKNGAKAYIFTNKRMKNDKNWCLIELKDN